MHFGETEVVDGKLGGIGVITGSRVAALAGPAQVLTTFTTRELVTGAGFSFADRGAHQLKGIEGEQHIFAVTGRDLPTPLDPQEASRRRAEIQPPPLLKRRSGYALIAGVGVLATISAVLVITHKAPHVVGPRVAIDTVFEMDPSSGKPIEQASGFTTNTKVFPRLAVGEGGVWVSTGHSISEVSLNTGKVTWEMPVVFGTDVAVRSGQVWFVAQALGAPFFDVTEVDPADPTRTQLVPLGRFDFQAASVVAAGGQSVWFDSGGKAADLVDPVSKRVVKKVPLPAGVTDIAVDPSRAGSPVWYINGLADSVGSIDPGTLKPGPLVPVGAGASLDRIVMGGGYVWVLDSTAGQVFVFDEQTGARIDTISVRPIATDIAVGPDAVWVSESDGSIARISLPGRDLSYLPSVGSPVLTIAVDPRSGKLWGITGRQGGGIIGG